MDSTLRKKFTELQQVLEGEELRLSITDPVVRMMLVAMAHQGLSIERRIDSSVDRLASLFVDRMLLNCDYGPHPALAILKIDNGREYVPYEIDEKVAFTLKAAKCNFRTLLPVRIIPGRLNGYYSGGMLYYPYEEPVASKSGDALRPGELWLAYEAASEVETLEGVVIALNHPLGGNRLTATVGRVGYELTPAVDLDFYAFSSDVMLTEFWRRSLVGSNIWLYRFGAPQNDSPVTNSEMPEWLYDMYEPETLSRLSGRRYLWIRITSPEGIEVPRSSHIEFNCVPAANYDISTARLSYTEPIRQLDNPRNGSQFVDIIEDPELPDDFFVRDFDVTQYDNGRIADDVRNLYRHYVDDYFAFVDNNALNDGAMLRNLRMAMLQLSDSLAGQSNSRRFEGSYLIRKPRNSNQPIAVSYITTQGARGNLLKAGMKLDCSLVSAGEVVALSDATSGRDKLVSDAGREELARFATTSADRIFSDIDLLQYCRVELIRAFGDDIRRFCDVVTSRCARPVENHIEQIIKLDFNFVSERHYQAAVENNFEQYLRLNIDMRKCFSNHIDINLRLV